MKKIKITESDLVRIIKRIIKENNYFGFNDLTSEDLYNISKWGIEGSYDYSSCYDYDDPVQCGIDDFREFLSTPWPLGLGNVPNNPIIYRLVKLTDIKDLNKINLGKSWFSNPKQYEEDCFFDMLDHIRMSKGYRIFLLKGRVNINNIDVPNTLWQRSTQWCENEIVIIDDSKIDLLDVTEIGV